MKNIILIIATLFIGLSACKNEEETEPQQNKEDLLCQEWEEEKNLLNGEDNSYYDHQYWRFDRDGTLVITTAYDFPETEVAWEYNWQWADHKESVEISIIIDKILGGKNNPIPFFKNKTTEWQKFSIRKLKHEELVFEYKEESDLYRVELKQR